jgi:hypothetical protein
MPDVTTTSWFPVVTLLLGYGTKSLSDWFQNRRDVAREREAREAIRQEQRFERRSTFQRQTLLDLQEACMQLTRATGATHHLDEMSFRSSGTWQRQLLPEELDKNYHLAQTRTLMLSVRVRDDVVRQLVEKLRSHSAKATMSTSQADSNREIANMVPIHDELQKRMGELLREIDDATT